MSIYDQFNGNWLVNWNISFKTRLRLQHNSLDKAVSPLQKSTLSWITYLHFGDELALTLVDPQLNQSFTVDVKQRCKPEAFFFLICTYKVFHPPWFTVTDTDIRQDHHLRTCQGLMGQVFKCQLQRPQIIQKKKDSLDNLSPQAAARDREVEKDWSLRQKREWGKRWKEAKQTYWGLTWVVCVFHHQGN